MNMNKSVKHRRKLNTEQLTVLELLYKFRFGTNDLFAEYFGKKDRSFVYKRLSILQERGLVGKRFDASYRLQGKPAAYYLTPDGARALNQHRDQGDEVSIKGIYKDATVSERFVRHCFAVFALYMQLMNEYGDKIEFLSKSDQSDEDMPRQKADAFLILQTERGERYYLVEILDDDTYLSIDASKRIKRYLSYHESGDWAVIDDDFPTVLFMCNSKVACEKVRKRYNVLADRAWVEDIDFRVMTTHAVGLDV